MEVRYLCISIFPSALLFVRASHPDVPSIWGDLAEVSMRVRINHAPLQVQDFTAQPFVEHQSITA